MMPPKPAPLNGENRRSRLAAVTNRVWNGVKRMTLNTDRALGRFMNQHWVTLIGFATLLITQIVQLNIAQAQNAWAHAQIQVQLDEMKKADDDREQRLSFLEKTIPTQLEKQSTNIEWIKEAIKARWKTDK